MRSLQRLLLCILCLAPGLAARSVLADSIRLNRLAQDSTGQVGGIDASTSTGLYRWEGDKWNFVAVEGVPGNSGAAVAGVQAIALGLLGGLKVGPGRDWVVAQLSNYPFVKQGLILVKYTEQVSICRAKGGENLSGKSSLAKEDQMTRMMSACGVLCSDCPAYLGDAKGVAHQKCTVAAWRRIYGLSETIENITCGGCLGPDDQLFHTSRSCKARRCCRSRGFGICAECPVERCPDLEKAQSVWDGVPDIAKGLSREDFVNYAQPYCDHRRRLAEARRTLGRPPR